MSTVFVFAPATGHNRHGHPEHAGRAGAVWQLLERAELLPALEVLPPSAATIEQLLRVHSRRVVEAVRQASEWGGGMLDADTYCTADSYELARLAAGGCCAAADQILSDRAANGLAVVRPPGHHAEQNRVGGFCLFNNVAAVARHAQQEHGLKRVAIVDYDVHHGNGTQEIFYRDPSVLFISTHLYATYFYPGTGAADELGAEPAVGCTMNIPFAPGVGDQGYVAAFSELVGPKLRLFRPELILVSAGFDAHWADPLASAAMSLAGYATISRELIELAAELCQGRILFVLEGGYLLQAVAYGALNLAQALLGRDQTQDPLGPSPSAERNVTDFLVRLRALHLPK